MKLTKLITGLGIISFVVTLCFVSFSPSVDATSVYSNGKYGVCTYNTCGITLTSSGTVNLNITPSTSTVCTVSSDVVNVGTSSATGYSLSLGDFDTSNNLAGSSGTISSISATGTSPGLLTANKWGYRVDSQEGFGSGPTSAITSAAIPTTTFGAVPISSSPQDILVNYTSAASPAIATNVWYGICVDITKPSGTYSDGVIYTAVVN